MFFEKQRKVGLKRFNVRAVISKPPQLLNIVGFLFLMLTLGYLYFRQPKLNASSQALLVLETSTSDDGTVCKLPVLNPFDPTILGYVRHPRQFNCTQLQPNLTYVDLNNHLRFNQTEYKKLLIISNSTIECNYQTLERGPALNNENDITFGPALPLKANDSVQLSKDSVQITCTRDEKVLYYNLHTLASKHVYRDTIGSEAEEQLSVIMYFTDSLSHSGAVRNLPETYKYLRDSMKAYAFHGYNKAGSNSFPNVIPILTGKRPYNAEPGMPGELGNGDFTAQTYYEWPIIWKEYSRKGYALWFSEDQPEFGVYRSNASDFPAKAVVHNFRPFWRTLTYDTNVKPKSSRFCFGNIAAPPIHTDIMRRMLLEYTGKLKFGFHFAAEISHDVLDEVERMDDSLKNFLKEVHESNQLNKTVLFFMSDHGHRFNTIRSTPIGRLEEHMPLVTLYFPEWFLKKHPHISDSLAINERRLASNFDIHETLVDIVNKNYAGQQRSKNTRGLSLLYKIPSDRSCRSAGIPAQYCVCSRWTKMNNNAKLAQEAGHFITHITNQFIKTSKYAGLCTELQLKAVHSAHEYDVNINQHERVSSDGKMLNVVAKLSPGDGLLEAVLNYNTAFRNFTLQGGISDINRLDTYESQAACLEKTAGLVRKLCFCIKKRSIR